MSQGQLLLLHISFYRNNNPKKKKATDCHESIFKEGSSTLQQISGACSLASVVSPRVKAGTLPSLVPLSDVSSVAERFVSCPAHTAVLSGISCHAPHIHRRFFFLFFKSRLFPNLHMFSYLCNTQSLRLLLKRTHSLFTHTHLHAHAHTLGRMFGEKKAVERQHRD